ncbi:MAG TPA: hypothetical protein VER11_08075 [Polyangiaceae bacterium]|nr:hypothetical protein [Polyangiaceae bacterium]
MSAANARAARILSLAVSDLELAVMMLGKAQTELQRWADELATASARVSGAAKLLKALARRMG